MSRRLPDDPRFRIFEGESIGLLPLTVIASVAAFLSWSWQDGRQDLAPPMRAPVAQQDIPVPPAPPSTGEHPAQRARGNLVAYFTDDDYPAAAIRNDEQGTVSFVLSVSPEGRVEQCQVAASSGSATLDGATCRILRFRARFAPARDSQGNAVADQIRGRIRWVLPSG